MVVIYDQLHMGITHPTKFEQNPYSDLWGIVYTRFGLMKAQTPVFQVPFPIEARNKKEYS